ncbi:hypothetical protein [Halolamina salifodinae]|uniref:Uncharacterized protein n=1 Tax=Halolamina salifodinae TaxID=1202767 RepID=A0A8T4GSN8_9EURY|nr:hypothetical protein [Halolamina salifodinae]MBP1986047.1 hypothetical protein [Halolamina salifodinae]
MSVDTSTNDTENRKSVASNTTDYQHSNDSELKSHFQQGGRYFLQDPATGESVNVSRLTAYAEYGREIYQRDAHHEIPLLKVDAPKFLDALTRQEHTEYHKQEPDPVEVDGFPLLRAGR